VFVAGIAGTGARLLLDLAIPVSPGGVPVSTLLINTAGSFALGVFVAAVPHRAPEWLRAGATTGLLGSFTTFSAVTVAAVALTGSGLLPGAAILLAISVVAGVLAALAGIALGARLMRSES
jgi:CrcB protein